MATENERDDFNYLFETIKAADSVNELHPDQAGIQRFYPKSIHSAPRGKARIGSIPRPKAKEKLPKKPGVLVRHSRIYKPGVEY